jgi:CubicO group peptidase (beta-lactamase class C family)
MLDRPMQYTPGEEYVYNTGGSHVLSALVSEVSGMNTSVFADEYLFSPLGITSFAWPGDPQGHAMGGSDLYLIPRYMAKFGYLYLRGGIWDGQIIVPPSWVATSTTTHYLFYPDFSESIGYAYQWWTYNYLGAYLARGYLGQYIWVIPSHDLVVVITGNSNSIDEVTPVEHFIIPATPMTPPPLSSPLILLPIGVGISITAILIVVYWKRRPE